MTNADELLKANRWLASQASGGSSGDPIYQAFEKIILKLDLKGDLIDFGAGAGNLINRIKDLGRFNSLSACDLMPRPENLDASIKWLAADLNYPLSIPDQSFDIILAAEVIEHLENPRALAREWFRLLRSGGTLIFSTPNNESWRALLSLIMRGHFIFFNDSCYPAHITALVRKDMERLLGEAGFTAPDFIFSDVGGVPKFPRVYWQTISAGILKGLRYSDNILAVARKNR